MERRTAPQRDHGTDLDGSDVQLLHPFGIGIDTHKKFIQVCVLIQQNGKVKRYEDEFETTWSELIRARSWAWSIARKADPDVEETGMRYTIESTGTYHMPVVQVFEGKPAIINPMLAGPTKRKTDVLDARLLANQCICGLWRESYVPPRTVETLRVLLAMRFECSRNATRTSNRINNTVLRFGHTIGRDASVRDSVGRAICEDLARGVIPQHPTVCPDGLPCEIQQWVNYHYFLLDQFQDMRDEYERIARTFCCDHTWPIESGVCNGRDLLRHLCSVPGVGNITAMVWLAIVGDPTRFSNEKQVSAYVGSDPSLKVSAGKVTHHTKRKGNARLHHVLKMISAHELRRANSKLGQWGRLIHRRQKNAGWGRAVNAVARRIAIMLWHVHRRGEDFEYEKYHFYLAPKVRICSVVEMGLSTRTTNLLQSLEIEESQQAANAMMSNLPQQKGFGPACLSELQKWIEANPAPKQTSVILKKRETSSSTESVTQ